MAAVAQRAKGAAAFQGIGRTPWGRPLWRDLVRVGGAPWRSVWGPNGRCPPCRDQKGVKPGNFETFSDRVSAVAGLGQWRITPTTSCSRAATCKSIEGLYFLVAMHFGLLQEQFPSKLLRHATSF